MAFPNTVLQRENINHLTNNTLHGWGEYNVSNTIKSCAIQYEIVYEILLISFLISLLFYSYYTVYYPEPSLQSKTP